jgi:hypothetical protein
MPMAESEIHQVGKDIIHLVTEEVDGSDGFLALIEGGGICLANSFPTRQESRDWNRRIFSKLFEKHRCGLGCMSMPGAEFLASAEDIEQLAGLGAALDKPHWESR